MKNDRFLPLFIFLFMLGIRDGYITLWKVGEADPLIQFPQKAQYLPTPDRRFLEKGIYIENPEYLAQILEDYLS